MKLLEAIDPDGTPATLILTFTRDEFTTVANGVGSYADGTPVAARVDEADIAF